MSVEPLPPVNDRSSSSAQQAVLIVLRRIGPATPDALAAVMGISRSAAVTHLRMLTAVGLVSRDVERHGVGRPRHRYDLTATAQTLLPSNYASLATDLLDALQVVGDEAVVDTVFAERRRRQAVLIRGRFADRRLDGAPFQERVRELAIIQDEQGYLCDCVATAARRLGGAQPAGDRSAQDAFADGHEAGPEAMQMRQANCAIYEVATRHPQACDSELELYREVLGTDVVREAHIASGDRTCTYRIEPLGPSGTA
jgi:predicted ArsR family transcriptional regulator